MEHTGIPDLIGVVALGVLLWWAIWKHEQGEHLRLQRRLNDAAVQSRKAGRRWYIAGDHVLTALPSGQAECSCGLWCRNMQAGLAHIETVAYNVWREDHEWDEARFDQEWRDLMKIIENESGEQENHL